MDRKRLLSLSMVALAGVCLAAPEEPVKLAFLPSSQKNFDGKTKIETGAEAEGCDFRVVSTLPDKKVPFVESAWEIPSERLALGADAAGYAFEFELKTDVEWKPLGGGVGQWSSRVIFYDAEGKELEVRPLITVARKGEFSRMRFAGTLPKGAAAMALTIGKDNPNIYPGQTVSVRNATYAIFRTGEPIPEESLPDMLPPTVKSLFTAPTEDRNLKVRYEIADDTAVDWGAVVVSNVNAGTTVPFVREGSVITLQPGAPWAEGAQRLTVFVRDTEGNAYNSHKAFMVGRPPDTPRITLRDDGITLVDGKPFFPIGIYGVNRHMFNGWDLDRAVGDLKAAGFNFIHSYQISRSPEFLAAARKHGVRCWTASKNAVEADDWFVSTGRNDPAVLAWYIGDDTSRNTSPAQLLDYDEACRFLDGTRLTCQADSVAGGAVRSLYQDFVPYTDVFMPEEYWIYFSDRQQDEACVAKVIRDMDRSRADIAKYGKGRAHGLWPILQAFHGRMWQRFPEEDELLATSYAAIIHGGSGITWFHYAGEINEKMKRTYSGCFQTQKDWAMMTNLTARLSQLSPVLLERSPRQPAIPAVLDGERLDPLGQPSVSVLVKNHGGAVYVFAVNASPKPVRARVFAEVADGAGEVLWENRRVSTAGGAFEDGFKGFGVHVYRFGATGTQSVPSRDAACSLPGTDGVPSRDAACSLPGRERAHVVFGKISLYNTSAFCAITVN